MFYSFPLGSSDNISYFDFPFLLVFATLLPIFFITCLCFGSLFFVKSPRSETGPQMRPIPYVTPHIREDRAIGQYCTCHTWNMAKTHNTCGSTDVQFPSPGPSSSEGPRSQDSRFKQSTLSRFGIRTLVFKQWTEITCLCVCCIAQCLIAEWIKIIRWQKARPVAVSSYFDALHTWKRDRPCTLKRVRATTVAVEKQIYQILWVSTCSLRCS